MIAHDRKTAEILPASIASGTQGNKSPDPGVPIQSRVCILYQENMREQRGTLTVYALWYVIENWLTNGSVFSKTSAF